MRIRIVALAAAVLSLMAAPFAFAAFEPAAPALDRASFDMLLSDPYAAAPMQVSLVTGFNTLDDML